MAARGRGGGIDEETFGRSARALTAFYRGAIEFERRRQREAVAAWKLAHDTEPENAYYRSILGL